VYYLLISEFPVFPIVLRWSAFYCAKSVTTDSSFLHYGRSVCFCTLRGSNPHPSVS
jgi:hypothetical protein